MQKFNNLYLFSFLILLKINFLFSMEEVLEQPNNKPVPSLKIIAANAVIKQFLHNKRLLKSVTDPKQCPSNLFDFINSQIYRNYYLLLLQLLPYKQKTLIGHEGPITAVRLSNSCNYALTGSEDTTIRLWDLHEGICIKMFKGHETKITALEFNEQECIFASGSEDGEVRIWDIKTEKCIRIINALKAKNFSEAPETSPYRIQMLKFVKNKNLFLKSIGFLGVWNFDQAAMSIIMRNINHDSNKKYSIFSYIKNKETDLYLSGAEIHIIDLSAHKIIFTFFQHPGKVTCAAISPNDKFAITGSDNGIAKLWNIETGECLHTLSGHKHIIDIASFSKDSTKALTIEHSAKKIKNKILGH